MRGIVLTIRNPWFADDDKARFFHDQLRAAWEPAMESMDLDRTMPMTRATDGCIQVFVPYDGDVHVAESKVATIMAGLAHAAAHQNVYGKPEDVVMVCAFEIQRQAKPWPADADS